MPDQVICSGDEVTAEWLTAVLVGGGALTYGAVTSFDLDAGQANWSTNARLNVTYSGDARGERPQRLFLKMVDFDADDEEAFGVSEVTYYNRDYVDVKNIPLVRCYDAASSDTLKRYHLFVGRCVGYPRGGSGRKNQRWNTDLRWPKGWPSCTLAGGEDAILMK